MQYDVVIVGGGVMGLSLALSLTQAGYQVAVVEACQKAPLKETHELDMRSIALSFASCRFFQSIGLGGCLQKEATPIREIHVSREKRWACTRLQPKMAGVDAFGAMVPLHALSCALLSAVDATKGIDFISPAQACAYKEIADGIELTLQTKEQSLIVTTRLLVGADGTHSSVRRLAGIAVKEENYQSHAIVSHVRLKKAHQGCAHERFTSTGPLAFLPLHRDRGGIVWSVPSHQREALIQCSDDDFLRQLDQAFAHRLGVIERIGQRQAFPLRLTVSEVAARSRVILIGNAAQTLHPVAGQGMNLGLFDVVSLLQSLQKVRCIDASVGQTYLELREARVQQVIQWTSRLASLFNQPLLPLRLLQAAALWGLSTGPKLQQYFNQHAMGVRYAEAL